MYKETIESLNDLLKYHRRRSSMSYWATWILAGLILGVSALVGGYIIYLLQQVAGAHVYSGQNPPSMPSIPDFASIASEQTMVVTTVSGFIIAVIATMGKLRFHLKRIVEIENEIINLHKVQAINSSHELSEESILKMSSIRSTENTVSVNPASEMASDLYHKITRKFGLSEKDNA